MQEVVYDVHMKKLCVVNRALVVKEKFLKYKNILVENQTTITTKINVLTMMNVFMEYDKWQFLLYDRRSVIWWVNLSIKRKNYKNKWHWNCLT